ncbi:MAG: S-adenosylmethionine decarboxylase proenzyme [Candidatus Rokuibacteriota bacterium]|nr:MAG: S-adenosylmethionine decarboxylase proenzyme [Candidatus Rokubacteria bacterium]
MQALGRHLLLELFDCDADAINSLEAVKTAMVEAAKAAQATIVDVVFHEFNPFGISGVVVIAESHLATADHLVAELGAARASVVELQRGIFLSSVPMPHKPAHAIGKPVVRR